MEKNIISFDLAKINRGKEKICKCKKPHYEIDTVNRLVMCLDCGAIVDPYDALVSLATRYEELEECQKRMIQQIHTYQQIVSEETEKMIKSRVFREMNAQYRRGMLPVCPECGQVFEPTKIRSWKNEELL